MLLLNHVLAVALSDPIFLWLLFGLLLVIIGAVLVKILGPVQSVPKVKTFDGGATKASRIYKSQYIPGGK